MAPRAPINATYEVSSGQWTLDASILASVSIAGAMTGPVGASGRGPTLLPKSAPLSLGASGEPHADEARSAQSLLSSLMIELPVWNTCELKP
jgi:hypothetical protein